MERRSFLFAAIVASSASVPAQDGWKDLTGKPVPEIAAENWLNTGDERPTAAALKGKVWLLEFFATT